jgi:hypothetical protein
LGEAIFEKSKIELLKIHGLIKDVKRELRLLEVEKSCAQTIGKYHYYKN